VRKQAPEIIYVGNVPNVLHVSSFASDSSV
jgi:hypothetical protein